MSASRKLRVASHLLRAACVAVTCSIAAGAVPTSTESAGSATVDVTGGGLTNGPPLVQFEDCGRLTLGALGCPTITLGNGETLAIENVGDFRIGDFVFVRGLFDFQSPICPPLIAPAIVDNTINECFQGCGTVVPGVLCQNFVTDDGRSFALEDFGGFGNNDRVWVKGAVDPESDLCNMGFAFPGIRNNTIGPCFEGCGAITAGPQGCSIFITDNDFYFIENTANLNPGGAVWVQGCLNPESRQCIPFIGPGIEDNVIGRCIEACGRIIEGPECILFRADDSTNYWIQNTGDLVPGDRARVIGGIDPLCLAPCSTGVPLECIRNNRVIGPLGDANCDGIVSVGDINSFVLALTDPATFQSAFPDCDLANADMNCDGFVSVSDINPFVREIAGRNAP